MSIIRDRPGGDAIFIEASRGVNYKALESYAWTGIDGVSISTITAQMSPMDIKLELMKEKN